MNLLGDGNAETGVELFEEQHVCNHYCCWPGFKLLPFSRKLEVSHEMAIDIFVVSYLYFFDNQPCVVIFWICNTLSSVVQGVHT